MLAIEILLKGTALLVVVFGVAAALRSASAATRHLVWAFGLVGLLSLPLLTAVTPWRLEILPALVRFETQPLSETPSSRDIDLCCPAWVAGVGCGENPSKAVRAAGSDGLT